MATRERLLTIARDLLLEQGIAGFSMRKVATACDLSATAIYRHFDDKDALVSAAIQEGFRVFASYLMDALEEATPLERMRKAGQRYFDFAVEHPRDYALIFMTPWQELGLHKLDEETRREGGGSFQFLVDRVAECQTSGDFAPGDPRERAACVWASVHGLASLVLNGQLERDAQEVEQLRERQLDLILAALAVGRPSEGRKLRRRRPLGAPGS